MACQRAARDPLTAVVLGRSDIAERQTVAPIQRARPCWVLRACIGISVVGLASGAITRQASAQIAVYDPANYAENVLHYINQLTQIKNQLDQVKYQLRALAKLPSAPWRNVGQSLDNIGGMMGAPHSLGYAASAVGKTFHNYFPVTQPVTDWPAEQRAKSQAAVNVFGAAIDATAQQQATVSAGRTAIQRMKQLNGVVNGHEQALELQNSAAVYSAEELMLLRQAVMAQTNIQAVYFAGRINEEVQRDEAARAALTQLAAPQTAPPDLSLKVSP
jgi:P-type conjugative transfer protein TrbJ